MLLPALFAVHLADGYIANSWCLAGWLGAAVLIVLASRGIDDDEIPRIGLMTAAFFVSSTIHIKILVTSVHLLLNGLVGAVLGRRAVLAIGTGLVMQCLLFHHGGWTTLGLNTCILGLPALAAGLAFPLLRPLGRPFLVGVVIGSGAAAASVGLNFVVLLFCGKEDWPQLARLVLLAHLPVVVMEGALLGVVVKYLEKVQPGLLRGSPPRPRCEQTDLVAESGFPKTEHNPSASARR